MMTNTENDTCQTIEHYKSELDKKEEIIEKLFEDIDNLKDEQREQGETFESKIHENDKNWMLKEQKFEDRLKQLTKQYQELKIEIIEIEIQQRNLIHVPINVVTFFILFLLLFVRIYFSLIPILIFIHILIKKFLNAE